MPPRAILVEDNSTIRSTLVPALQELGHVRVVAMAETADEALLASREHGWELMVLDLFLREGTGMMVLESLRERSTGQRIVVLTNYATPDVRQRCNALGADAVYDKSTELEAFFECLQDVQPATE